MANDFRHPRTRRATRARLRGGTVRWPRNLAAIGLGGLLLSAWGGIVPYVGPTFGFNANGSPSWQWNFLHAMLYLVPGAVGAAASLLILSRSRGGRTLARLSLGFFGLVLLACGAWFVVGPAAWPALGASGAVFTPTSGASAAFVNQVGYNLGVGVLLAAVGGMAMKASTGEREVAAPARAETPVDGGRVTEASPADRVAEPAPADRVAEPAPAERVAEASPADRVAEASPAERVAEPAPAERVAEPAPTHVGPMADRSAGGVAEPASGSEGPMADRPPSAEPTRETPTDRADGEQPPA